MGIFGAEKSSGSHGAVDSIVGEKAVFRGEIVSSGAVSINGEFEGKISAQGEVILARGSKLKGNVDAGSVIVSGKVEGNITAEQSLEITKAGKVHGDLTGGKIIIDEGASYRGRVRVETGEGEEAEEKEEKKDEAGDEEERETESIDMAQDLYESRKKPPLYMS